MRLPFPTFSTAARSQQHIGEVIETATTEYLAQCLEPEDLSFPVMPAFGSWVKSRDEESGNQVYGVVYHATTSPIDSVHRARALGLSLEELREQQPQIFAMLKTEFRVAIVGFELASEDNSSQPQRGKIYQYIPPRPPQIHQAVYECEPDEIVDFSQELDFLRTLLDVGNAPVDSLVAAAIREVYKFKTSDRAWLVEAGRTLSILLKDDYDRLRVILKQIHP
ncbi:HerA-ATP synthase, barrel domain-containing protein [Planktothrix sp. PCC 11201]|uniref:HAS-barrel domain-containing protein n=1 Tax=Planktothrix sp. PCC 11201 TaxID=1729650 RepID=UPI00091F8A19|nr:HAS-barrel domain-containing protein [Planktothrix sp. PCC 11201]SKB13074.1 HerA-ATP synthase, barrel domain-containing protein [Planktothrix sp. PCC 11201]